MVVPGDLNSSVRKDVQVRFLSSAMPLWWNGSHAWLKPRWPQGRGGSTPPGGTFFLDMIWLVVKIPNMKRCH